jgi:hypothetical protein
MSLTLTVRQYILFSVCSLLLTALNLCHVTAARDLVAHFTSVGTPITTGGGELAHTM